MEFVNDSKICVLLTMKDIKHQIKIHGLGGLWHCHHLFKDIFDLNNYYSYWFLYIKIVQNVYVKMKLI